jgi:hypothetical protein
MPSLAALLAVASPLLCVAATRMYLATLDHLEDIGRAAFLYLGATAIAVVACVYVAVRAAAGASRVLAIAGLVANGTLACSILKWGFWFAWFTW